MVESYEEADYGYIGQDDLFIIHGDPEVEIEFSHHADVIIETDEDDPVLKSEMEKWLGWGWEVQQRPVHRGGLWTSILSWLRLR